MIEREDPTANFLKFWSKTLFSGFIFLKCKYCNKEFAEKDGFYTAPICPECGAYVDRFRGMKSLEVNPPEERKEELLWEYHHRKFLDKLIR